MVKSNLQRKVDEILTDYKEPVKCKYSPAGLPCFIRNPDSKDCSLCLKSQIEQAREEEISRVGGRKDDGQRGGSGGYSN